MKEHTITLPVLDLIVVTRVALGIGLGLLFADWLSDQQRRAVGGALFLAGALSTIPLALEVLGKKQVAAPLSNRAA